MFEGYSDAPVLISVCVFCNVQVLERLCRREAHLDDSRFDSAHYVRDAAPALLSEFVFEDLVETHVVWALLVGLAQRARVPPEGVSVIRAEHDPLGSEPDELSIITPDYSESIKQTRK